MQAKTEITIEAGESSHIDCQLITFTGKSEKCGWGTIALGRYFTFARRRKPPQLKQVRGAISWKEVWDEACDVSHLSCSSGQALSSS